MKELIFIVLFVNIFLPLNSFAAGEPLIIKAMSLLFDSKSPPTPKINPTPSEAVLSNNTASCQDVPLDINNVPRPECAKKMICDVRGGYVVVKRVVTQEELENIPANLSNCAPAP